MESCLIYALILSNLQRRRSYFEMEHHERVGLT